eukprot:UN01084
MKASLAKVQAFKFILQNAASKLHFSKYQSSKSNLRFSFNLPTCSTVQPFKNLLKKSKIIYSKRIWAHFEKRVWRVDFERFFLEHTPQKVPCLVE